MSHTKKSLLTSITALVVCFTMLVSSTFAWFTSTVTSSNNIIASGNLKVELWHDNAYTKSQAMTSVEVTEDVDKNGKEVILITGIGNYDGFVVVSEKTEFSNFFFDMIIEFLQRLIKMFMM